MLRLTRKLLQGIARTLARYANSIEKLLAQYDSPASRSSIDYSDERPPAHWLAKVRQGAPHLLDNRCDDTQTVSYSSETFNESGPSSPVASSAGEKPPAHWVEKVRRGAPYLLDEQFVYKKHNLEQSAANDRESLQSSRNQTAGYIDSDSTGNNEKKLHTSETRYKSSLKLLYRKKPGLSSEINLPDSYNSFRMDDHKKEMQHDKSHLKDTTGLTQRHSSRKAKKPFAGAGSLISSEKKTTAPAPEFGQPDPTGSPAQYSEIQSANLSSNRQHRVQRPNVTVPDITAHINNYRSQSRSQDDRLILKNRVRIGRDSRDQYRITPHFPDKITKSGAVSKNTPSQRKLNKTAASHPDKTAHFFFSYKPEEHLNRNRARINRHLPETTGTVSADNLFGTNQKQYLTRITRTIEPFESGLSHWPNLPGERKKQILDDQWPELPEENLSTAETMIQSTINFAQLQHAITRDRQSEIEQRGISWSA
ncbi:hypothetical protein [Nitrosomonas marina]|uniref:Uncharacterized protein n=1 Tax=Nitrosomonas marina TaxID=917 RepID=A0A1H8GBH3_9PROT|nr:hypothetical protein [Nitrosomonas marina]SEN41095.1 hypothetical protein SAMN05216325_11726 [Nitrosomonas marina]